MVANPMQNRHMSVNSYLILDENSPNVRYEYYHGYVRAMSGGSLNHSSITANMLYLIKEQLGLVNRCRVYTSDARVKLAEDIYVYPDITVSCDSADHLRGRETTLHAPRLVVEVLSSSTELYDRMKKLPRYQACSSVQEIVFVSQDAQFVEIFRRPPDTQWLYQQYRSGEKITLESLKIEFPLASLYAGLDIPGDEPDSPPNPEQP